MSCLLAWKLTCRVLWSLPLPVARNGIDVEGAAARRVARLTPALGKHAVSTNIWRTGTRGRGEREYLIEGNKIECESRRRGGPPTRHAQQARQRSPPAAATTQRWRVHARSTSFHSSSCSSSSREKTSLAHTSPRGRLPHSSCHWNVPAPLLLPHRKFRGAQHRSRRLLLRRHRPRNRLLLPIPHGRRQSSLSHQRCSSSSSSSSSSRSSCSSRSRSRSRSSHSRSRSRPSVQRLSAHRSHARGASPRPSRRGPSSPSSRA